MSGTADAPPLMPLAEEKEACVELLLQTERNITRYQFVIDIGINW